MSRGVAVLGVLVALVAVGCESREPEPEGAFYFRAEIDTSPGSARATYEPAQQGDHTLQVWFRDAEHYRQEVDPYSPILDWEAQVLVADGEETTSYSPRTGHVHRDRVSLNSIQATGGVAPNIGFGLGPVLGGVEAFTSSFADVPMEHIGTEEMLGRTVEVYEYPTGDGLGRYYIDHGAEFILRHTSERGAHQTWDAHVVELDLDPQFDDERFEANVPDEAVPMPAAADCGGSIVTDALLPFQGGFIEFSYLPTSYLPAGNQQTSGRGCDTISAWAAAEAGEGYIVVEQFAIPPTGAPAFVDGLEQVEVAGHEGYRQVEGDLERLAWVQDGVVVTIESNAAPFEELLRIAESGRVAS